MFGNVTPETAITFVRFSISLICCWPLPAVATKTQVLCFRISKVLNILSVLGLFFPVLYALIHHDDDIVELTKKVIVVVGCVNIITQILLSSLQYDRFQRLVETITANFQNANFYERCVFQRYVDMYSKFYGLAVLWIYTIAVVFIFGSIFLPQPFPLLSEYPFRVDYEPLRTIIFVHQAIFSFQCSAAISINMFAALLLLYAAARFEILMIDMRKATSVHALVECLEKFHMVTRIAKDIVEGTQFIALFTVLYSSVPIIFGGLNIIGRHAIVIKLQFLFLSWMSLMEVFMCVLPADNLINVSENTVRSVYESKWYDQILDVQKTVLRILVPQVPIAISVKCVIPILSLEYYCSVLLYFVFVFIRWFIENTQPLVEIQLHTIFIPTRVTMFRNVTPETAITFVRFSISLICCWPLPAVATKTQVLCFKISKVLNILSVLGLFFPLLYALILHRDDAVELTKIAIIMVGCLHVITQIVLCSFQYDRFQRLVETIIANFKNAKIYERCVYQQYVDTYSTFYGLTIIWYYVSPMVVVFGSILLPQPFPTVSEYPFRVDYEPVRTIIFIHQAFVGFQCSASVSVNMFAALLILYTAARFEILMIDLREAASVDALVMCVKKYHVVTRIGKDVVEGIQYIALFTVLYTSIGLVFCGLNIIGRQAIVIKLQFFFLAWLTLTEVFMCALPADNLIHVSQNTVRSVYESEWYDQALDVQKTVLRILVPQVPVVISIKCIIPILSLEFFCSYISHAVSLFTALRMVLVEEDDILGCRSTNSTC
ncbi:uncharacterized protein LOC117227739 [Megalopta genalis]|uniref:uncharacterized protein LOC117227739 n=1 Tax=Megalopta genalis TaxID=115081 RepID=UPI003FD53940